MMPSKYGSIKRCHIFQDPDAFKRNINIYVISEDVNGRLIKTTSSIKKNLKTWLNNYKMLSDTVDILDAKIVNIGVEFDVMSELEVDKYAVLARASDAVRTRMARLKQDISEPFSISNVYKILRNVSGVLDVTSVKLVRKAGGDYSSAFYDLDSNTTVDGRLLLVPENVVVEIKFPDIDIRGTIR